MTLGNTGEIVWSSKKNGGTWKKGLFEDQFPITVSPAGRTNCSTYQYQDAPVWYYYVLKNSTWLPKNFTVALLYSPISAH